MAGGPVRDIFKQGKAYEEIARGCRANGVLFEDNLFPPGNNSLGKSHSIGIQWNRPQEITSNPKLFVDGASRFDVRQGQLGNCWFLAAVAGLSMDEYLMKKVVPEDQSFDQGYCGMFRFNFWHYGEWQTVVVDDRLPNNSGELVFVHSEDRNEFWSALMEKAYAKLYGSYENLSGGNAIEAMEDFTGGVSESIEMTENPPPNLFNILMTSYKRDSQIGCSINAKPGVTEARLDSGLIAGHAYTITGVNKVDVQGRPVRLIRVRNPWGQVEWNGAWSDNSGEWDLIAQSEREELGLITAEDGEFWMEFNDFKHHFERIDMCHLGPEYNNKGTGKMTWEEEVQSGRWKTRVTAGGCRNYPETFHINPQFKLVLEDEDDVEDDDDTAQGGGVTFIVAVMQKNRRVQRKMGVANLTMGFSIYNMHDEKSVKALEHGGLPKKYFLSNASTARSPTFTNTREVSGRFKLPPGTYCIVPSTFEPHQEGDFLFRIYSLKKSSSATVDEESSMDVHQPAHAQEDPQLTSRYREYFRRLAGEDMEVTPWELQQILNGFLKEDLHGSGFSIESCKTMVALSDGDRSGKLGFEEFRELCRNIRAWQAVFKRYDTDNSATFSAYEMKDALRALGFRLSNDTFEALVLRYADRNGVVTFDSFIAAGIKLKHMFTCFSKKHQGGQASFGLEEFLVLNLYS